MRNHTYVLEYFPSTTIKGLGFGVIKVTKATVPEIKACVVQNAVPIDQDQYLGVRSSVLNDGYITAYPVCLDEDLLLLDGNTRMLACCSLVEEGLAESVHVPFYVADQKPDVFNSASRGTRPEDIAHLFKSDKSTGINCGNARRRVEQCVEAVKMMRTMNKTCSFSRAYDSYSMQSCISSIVRNLDKFLAASDAAAEVGHYEGLEPADVKTAHWVALFYKHGVDNRTRSIARTCVITTRGTTQEERFNRFLVIDAKATEMWGV